MIDSVHTRTIANNVGRKRPAWTELEWAPRVFFIDHFHDHFKAATKRPESAVSLLTRRILNEQKRWRSWVSWVCVMARVVASAVLAINLGSMAESLYLSRYAIYCGLGMGHLNLLFFVPSLALLMTTCFYQGGGALAKIRNGVFVLNALYIALLLIEGTCFSCVDSCVENLQRRQ